ncbi:MAG: DUF3881 family protein [Lachnospiraceae bacterium]|nr:DUF3881 family protein [Lachnospiraceae bacterium]
MHKYLRAIGFSRIRTPKQMHDLVMEVIQNADKRSYTSNSETTMLAEFCKDFANRIGMTVCGEFDEKDEFSYEYSFPYFRGDGISTEEDISVERHAEKESYAGVCNDLRVGVSLIFYLQNMIDYAKIKYGERLPVRGTSLTLSALSISGKVVLPIRKNKADMEKIEKETTNRNKLIAQARQGDEEAIETLTLEDMDTYNAVSKKIRTEDVLSLVDTYFMPYGVECDQYSILGEILDCSTEKNKLTGEELWILGVTCNDLIFDVCINKKDLYGEPAPGRRFKGTIWMQGIINFPETYGVSG